MKNILLSALLILALLSCRSNISQRQPSLDCARFVSELPDTGWVRTNSNGRSFLSAIVDSPNGGIVFNSGDSLKELPRELICFKKLRQLIISNNPNIDFSKAIQLVAQLPNLQELSFIDNNMRYLPKNIAKLKKLKALSVDYNPIVKFPRQIKYLKQLHELVLANDKNLDLRHLLNLIKNLPITYLDVRGCAIKKIPPTISKMKHLETLILSGNPLTELPCEINNLKNCRIVLSKDIDKNVIPPCLKDYPFEFR